MHIKANQVTFPEPARSQIPPTRGMGSSSAALVAGLAAGLAFGGKDMSTPATKKLLLQLAAEEEGHADNVAPAIYGGFQIAFNTDEQWITQRVGLPDGLQCVLFIPDDEMSTTEARAVLPSSLSYKDAVHNISRAAMLVNCFSTAQFDPLRYAMQDRLHQQYRSHMFPFEPFIQTALEAGAHGAFLSGAGPTVLAIAGGVGIADPGSDTMSQFLAEAVSARGLTSPMSIPSRGMGTRFRSCAAHSFAGPLWQVSEAMLDVARKQSLPGTVHIATPSLAGFNSVGTAADGTVLWAQDQSRDMTMV